MLCFIATCFIVRLFDQAPKGSVPIYVPIWVQKYLFGMKDKKRRASPIDKLIRKHTVAPLHHEPVVLGRINILQVKKVHPHVLSGIKGGLISKVGIIFLKT